MRARAGLMVAVLATVLVACSPVDVDGQNLAWTSWRAISIAGQAPIAGSEPTITFDGDRVHVFGGCGTRVSDAPATVRDGRLEIPPMLDPLAMCLTDGGRSGSPVMPIEATFFSILLSNESVSLRGKELHISSLAGEIVLVRA